MTGSVRSWIHYIDLRSAHGTQKEHMEIAEAIRCIFTCQFPAVSDAMGWTREECPECVDAPSITIE
jgi:thymidylate synthase (FAD)